VTVGAYNPTKNVVELEGLDGTFATTVSQFVTYLSTLCYLFVHFGVTYLTTFSYLLVHSVTYLSTPCQYSQVL